MEILLLLTVTEVIICQNHIQNIIKTMSKGVTTPQVWARIRRGCQLAMESNNGSGSGSGRGRNNTRGGGGGGNGGGNGSGWGSNNYGEGQSVEGQAVASALKACPDSTIQGVLRVGIYGITEYFLLLTSTGYLLCDTGHGEEEPQKFRFKSNDSKRAEREKVEATSYTRWPSWKEFGRRLTTGEEEEYSIVFNASGEGSTSSKGSGDGNVTEGSELVYM